MTGQGQRDILDVLGSGGEQPPDPDMEVLIRRLEVLERDLRLQAVYRQQMEDAQADHKAELARIIQEKDEAIDGLRAALEQREKQLGEMPKDPRTLALMLDQLSKEAVSNHKHKREKFIKEMKNAPTGIVENSEGHSVLLTINGVSVWIIPGKNEVPAPYVRAWEDHLESVKFARERQDLLSGKHEFEELNVMLGRESEWQQ